MRNVRPVMGVAWLLPFRKSHEAVRQMPDLSMAWRLFTAASMPWQLHASSVSAQLSIEGLNHACTCSWRRWYSRYRASCASLKPARMTFARGSWLMRLMNDPMSADFPQPRIP